MLIINLFKDNTLWQELAKYNDENIRIFKTIAVAPFMNGTVDFQTKDGKFISKWFDPEDVKNRFLPEHWGEFIPLMNDPKFIVHEVRPNYMVMFLLNLLYSDRKDILIEDVACGAAKTMFYMSKLGFNNWSLVDNYSQMASELLDAYIKNSGTNVILNNLDDVKPTVFNQVGYPAIKIKQFSPSLELVCRYNNSIKEVEEALGSNYTKLCMDSDRMCTAFCRNDKFEEFSKKLQPYISEEK